MDRSEAVPGTPLTASGDPLSIIHRLFEDALTSVDADRCTLTSIDSGVMRIEASRERDGSGPGFVGAEYPLEVIQQQPMLREATQTGTIVTGPGFADVGDLEEHTRADVGRMHSIAIVPLSGQDRILALLILSRQERRDFARTDLDRLQQIGSMAVLALRNARLLQEVEEAQRRALDALTRISRLVAASDDRSTVFERMTETVAELTGARRAAFWLVTGGWLVAQPSAGFPPEQLARMRIEVALSRQHRIARVLDGEAVRFAATEFAPDDPERPMVEEMGVRDGLAVPWRTAEQSLGILMAYDARNGWGEQEEWMLRLAARSSALVWQGYEAEHRLADVNAREVSRLAEYAARVAALDEQKSEFLRLASHELRTPMTLVRGYLSMLEEGALGELPREAAKVIPVMSARMAQMGQLVEQMLSASRAQEAGFEAEVEETDIDDLVLYTAGTLEALAGDHHMLRVTASGGARGLVDGEKTRLILTNLISNAIKYSPAGGEVEVLVIPNGRMVRISVKDHGIGIRPEDIGRLFRPFGRVQSAETEGIEGVGLGLYLARRLARVQHGDIEVSSEPGVGSTFTLVVPRHREG